MQAQRWIKTQADKGCKGTSNKIWWHLQYQVQKGSGPMDDSFKEWATSA